MDQRLITFLDDLDVASSQGDAWLALLRFTAQFDVASLNYGWADPMAPSVDEDLICLSTLPPDWMEQYMSEGLVRQDHAFWHCISRTAPVLTGSVVADRLPGLTAENQRFMDLAKAECGLTAGVTIPVRTNDPRRAGGLTLGTELGAPAFKKLMSEHGAVLYLAAMHFHIRMHHLLQKQEVPDVQLSPREREVLTLLALGLRPDRIAERLNIARVTVDLHVKNARQKLGASTREHCVAMAIACRQITP